MRIRVAFWLPAILGLAADLVSKHFVFAFLSRVLDHRLAVLDEWLVLQLQRNEGGVFGILPGRGYVFVVLSVLALVAVVWMLWASRPDQRWLHAALGLVVAGALGNLYDRISLGYVRDFIYIQAINYPAFNVADMCICVAAAMLVIQIVREGMAEKKAKDSQEKGE